MTVDVTMLNENDMAQLYQFRHDKFQPDALRSLAEESIYLTAFTESITESLKEVDLDFVRYVAGRANIQRQFTQRYLESIRHIVKQAVQNTVSSMVVSGLSAPKVQEEAALLRRSRKTRPRRLSTPKTIKSLPLIQKEGCLIWLNQFFLMMRVLRRRIRKAISAYWLMVKVTGGYYGILTTNKGRL